MKVLACICSRSVARNAETWPGTFCRFSERLEAVTMTSGPAPVSVGGVAGAAMARVEAALQAAPANRTTLKNRDMNTLP